MHFSPRSLQQVPMDAQWMLKGCSMVAYANLSTLSLPSHPSNPLLSQIPLQRYKKFLIYANFDDKNLKKSLHKKTHRRSDAINRE